MFKFYDIQNTKISVLLTTNGTCALTRAASTSPSIKSTSKFTIHRHGGLEPTVRSVKRVQLKTNHKSRRETSVISNGGELV